MSLGSNTNNNIPNQNHIDAKDNSSFSSTKKLNSSRLFINVQEQSPITASSSSHSSNSNQIINDFNLTSKINSRLNNSLEDLNNDNISISSNKQENPYYFSLNHTDIGGLKDFENCSNVLIKQKKSESIAENKAFTSSKDSPNANELPTIKHMEQLVNGMMNLLHKYNDTEQKGVNSNNNDAIIEASHSFYCTSNQKNDQVMIEKEQGKLKHELVTTMRDSLPLNYLIYLNKRNGNQPLQWHPCRYESCYNIYKSKGSLHRHIYSHTGEKPYICQFPGCDKSYSASDRLAEHMHTHTNSRPYKCVFPKCSKAYNDPKTLREHKKTHGEKTFLCTMTECNKAFHRKTHLKQHMRTHNKLDGTGPLFGEPKREQEEDNNTPTKDLSRSLLNNNDDKHFRISRKRPSPEK